MYNDKAEIQKSEKLPTKWEKRGERRKTKRKCAVGVKTKPPQQH
jgi:hypothetical protein